ncbi:unnamed protein product [Mytilus coruscus]|uniref:Uncharacterized protein n=1 Tax=Mytilus coruscus TaxID=42192 RepID=A0A6J8AV88_MYTCO|nr:unnamed protein product [Mytilus coruscus]
MSSVHQLDLGSDLKSDELEHAHETKMWTIPSLTEGHLRDLMEKFPDSMKDIMNKHIIPFMSAEKARFELNNTFINVLGPNNQRWKIISGHGKHEINIDITDINDPVITMKADDNNPEVMRGEGITKTFLGKCIIKKCGNEGTTKNESMRKLLQVAIDRLPNEYDKNTLKNAKVYIYNSMETLILVSGDGINSFVINTENGNPKLKCSKLEKKKQISKLVPLEGSCLVLIVVITLILFPCHFCVMGVPGFILWKIWKRTRFILWKIWKWRNC